ncbi:biotin--[acetyl-CoA-carboxylase] ligase [Candidatus Pelagibacter sp. HIMB1483]|uniref:biotin--[acetyl-CoA-carboxylase] ligase n=1 Tax=Candidatus Pelagibacter sp. HIMB1483 TaxID=3415414 RepID=UPI003F852BFE
MKLKQFNFKKVKSTNQTAIRLIKSSKNEFGLIVSESQSNGKGQYGRKWISYKGNVFLSFFYKLENIKLSLSSLTKINCFLVKEIISKYYKKKITFKSPNDLLINKKKICGILQEKIEKSKKQYFVVGVGLNLIKSPIIPNYPTTNLFEITNQKINKKKFVKELKITFEKFLSKYYKAS